MSAIINTLRATVQAVPDSWEARLGLVEALLNEGRRGEALEVLQEVSELPAGLDERIKAGRAWGLLDPESGLEVISGILEEQPTHAAAHLEKARICRRIGDLAIARQHYFTAVTFDAGLEDTAFAAELTGQETAQSIPAPVTAPAPQIRDHVFYPASGKFPVQTLREALGMPPIRRLADPATIPEPPQLKFQSEPAHQEPVYTPEAVFLQQVQNVHVIPKAEEQVVYDYQEPDNSIFEPRITTDDIYVAAPVTEEGEPVATLEETVARHARDRALQMARTQKRDRVTSLAIALGGLGLICVLLTLIVIVRPSPAPPMITASVIPALDEDLARQEIQRPQLQRRPASLGSPPLDVVSLAAASPVTMPDLDASDLGTGMVGIDAGMGLGPSMDFGSPGDGVSFMGFKTRGDLAVVFDITNSMYAATPVVVVEIQRAYRNARVVCVFGGGFKREEFSGLIPYRENEKVRAIVNRYAEGEITEKLNQALFSLKRCISLEVDHAGDFRQSVGAGIEALLGQSNPPGTIFVFSDFEDGVEPDYMDEIKRLVQRKGTKVVFWYPFEKGSRKWNAVREQYEAFAKDTQGELKEEAIK